MKKIYIVLLYFLVLSSFSQTANFDKNKLFEVNVNHLEEPSLVSQQYQPINPFIDLLYKLTFKLMYGIVVESIFERNRPTHKARITRFPYEYEGIGNFIYADSLNFSLVRLDIANHFAVENKNALVNDFNVKFRFLKRMDISMDYVQFATDFNAEKENHAQFSVLLNYHRLRSQRVDFWFGIGTTYISEDINEFGFSYGVGTEWFVKKPISIYVDIKATNLAGSTISNSKVILKYHLKKYYISSGYQHYTLRASNIDAFTIGVGVFIN